MSRSLSKDRWSDQGDPVLARRLAWMWVSFVIVSWCLAGFTWLAWWVAQVGNYQNNWRGFNEGDGFPWIAVALLVIAGAWCVSVARLQWARARHLAQGR